MKNLIVLFVSLMVTVGVRAAELPEAFDLESTSNLVETVKQKALACDPKHDENTCLPVVVRISRFCDEVTLAESSMDAVTKSQVCGALIEMRKVLKVVQGKVDEAIDYNSMRLEQLPKDSEAKGTVYGIDLAEAHGLLVSQFSRDIGTLNHILKRTRELDKRLTEKAKRLSQ